ncbi:MAG: hypothetical protein ACK5HT_21930, partial [Draconibacterium sp.]
MDLITYEDPHFRIFPQFIRNVNNKEASGKNYRKAIKALPFSLLQISDSLIVDESLNENFIKGDLILSINGVSASKLLDYTYRDRYINSSLMQLQYHMMVTPDYDVELVRDGKTMTISATGASLEEYNKQLNNRDIAAIVSGDIGYIEINEFQKNKTIIKELRKLIKQVKDVGG